jgi:hypothetical protein
VPPLRVSLHDVTPLFALGSLTIFEVMTWEIASLSVVSLEVAELQKVLRCWVRQALPAAAHVQVDHCLRTFAHARAARRLRTWRQRREGGRRDQSSISSK